jgi:hypothetical protein
MILGSDPCRKDDGGQRCGSLPACLDNWSKWLKQQPRSRSRGRRFGVRARIAANSYQELEIEARQQRNGFVSAPFAAQISVTGPQWFTNHGNRTLEW